jgi:uncharacterized protein
VLARGSTTGRALGAALAGSLVLAGCRSTAPDSMVPIPPPRSWAAELAARRADKDRQFRTSPDTPIPEASRPTFKGLEYWAPDSRYYFVGPVHARERPERFTVPTTAGGSRPCEKVGWLRFPLAGKTRTLQVYRLLDAEPQAGAAGLFLPFLDATAGEETYPAGRYVDLVGPDGGPFVLDFNTAYSPSCAYGSPERFACPVTPPENRLDVRIEAGERGYAREPSG